MIAHTTLHVSDVEKSKAFYLAALGPLGYVVSRDFPEYKVVGFADPNQSDFWLHGDGAKQTTHVAFEAKNKEAVQQFYDAALKAGGTDNGKPGPRADYGPNYYAAFVHDLDGHNIEVCYFGQ